MIFSVSAFTMRRKGFKRQGPSRRQCSPGPCPRVVQAGALQQVADAPALPQAVHQREEEALGEVQARRVAVLVDEVLRELQVRDDAEQVDRGAGAHRGLQRRRKIAIAQCKKKRKMMLQITMVCNLKMEMENKKIAAAGGGCVSCLRDLCHPSNTDETHPMKLRSTH